MSARPTYVIAHQINDYASFVARMLLSLLVTGLLNDRRHELMGVLDLMRRYIDEYKETGSRETLAGVVELCGQLDELIAPAISYLSPKEQSRYRELIADLTPAMDTDPRISTLLDPLPESERRAAVRFLSDWDDQHNDFSPAGLAARLEALTAWIKSAPEDR